MDCSQLEVGYPEFLPRSDLTHQTSPTTTNRSKSLPTDPIQLLRWLGAHWNTHRTLEITFPDELWKERIAQKTCVSAQSRCWLRHFHKCRGIVRNGSVTPRKIARSGKFQNLNCLIVKNCFSHVFYCKITEWIASSCLKVFIGLETSFTNVFSPRGNWRQFIYRYQLPRFASSFLKVFLRLETSFSMVSGARGNWRQFLSTSELPPGAYKS